MEGIMSTPSHSYKPVISMADKCREILSDVSRIKRQFYISSQNKAVIENNKRQRDELLSHMEPLKRHMSTVGAMMEMVKKRRSMERSWVVDGVPFEHMLARIACTIINAEVDAFNHPEKYQVATDERRVIINGETTKEYVDMEGDAPYRRIANNTHMSYSLSVPADGDDFYRFTIHTYFSGAEIHALGEAGIMVESAEYSKEGNRVTLLVARDDTHGTCTPSDVSEPATSMPWIIEEKLVFLYKDIESCIYIIERCLGMALESQDGVMAYASRDLDYQIDLAEFNLKTFIDTVDFKECTNDEKHGSWEFELAIARSLDASVERHDAVQKNRIELRQYESTMSEGLAVATFSLAIKMDGTYVERLAHYGIEVINVRDFSDDSHIQEITCRGYDDNCTDSDIPHGYWGWSVEMLTVECHMRPEDEPWLDKAVKAGINYIGDDEFSDED